MALRAGETVWWPGISADLARVRDMCGQCVRNAPSLPALPPVKPRVELFFALKNHINFISYHIRTMWD